MTNKQIIEGLIDEQLYDEAINALTINIKEDAADAQWPFMRGMLLWRLGRRGEAISDYERSVAIDPDGPAATALNMARSIMDFFNPDLLNP